MAAIEKVLEQIDANREAALKRLFELLSIKSISTDPAYAGECDRAADWLAKELNDIGFTADIRPTSGRPIVVGHAKSKISGVPHVLFYGHYDVQPVDPLDLWTNDPFAPALSENGQQIIARGASDDKGQLMTFLEACRAFKETGGLPCDISVMFEGEEECGSPSLPEFLQSHKKELAVDLALVCDTNMWDAKTPAITIMLRGLASEEVVITCADRDLHSGLYGGAARNPIHILSKIIANLHDETGAIAIPGFYDSVQDLPEEVEKQWSELDFDELAFLNQVGLSHPAGEQERSVLEQIWARPACDVNGIVGGYTGPGVKTIVPSQASAKFSFRLVGKQDPEEVLTAFRSFVEEHLPADARAEFISHGGSPALQLPYSSEIVSRARRALREEWGKQTILVGSGGSIPIVGTFKRELKMDALMIGFGLDDDRIHSPNEKYELTSFQKGACSWARVLTALSV